MLVPVDQSNSRFVHMICVKLHKWHTDLKTNLQLLYLSTKFRIAKIFVTFCLQGITTQKTSRRSSWTGVLCATQVRFLLIYGFVQTFFLIIISVFSVFCFFFGDATRPRHKRQLSVSATALRQPCCKFANLVCVVI